LQESCGTPLIQTHRFAALARKPQAVVWMGGSTTGFLMVLHHDNDDAGASGYAFVHDTRDNQCVHCLTRAACGAHWQGIRAAGGGRFGLGENPVHQQKQQGRKSMRLYQRNGNWWIDLGEQGGKRIRCSLGTKNKQQAQEAAAKVATDYWRQKQLGEQPSTTWDAAALAWLEEHQHLKSLAEVKRVLKWLTQHLRGLALQEITLAKIQAVAKARREHPANSWDIARAVAAGRTPPAPRPTSPATLNRHMAQLSAVLNFARQRGWLATVPYIPKAKEPPGRVDWLTRQQAAALLDELPKHLEVMARFALATGLRESNVRLLRWSQVDIAQAVCWHESGETKSGRAHRTELNADALRVLAEQRGKHSVWVFPVPKRKGSELVADEPTSKISNHAWRKACVRAGLPTLRFHDLRHTWASWHRQAGTPDPVLQALGGWASQAMVQRYGHLGPSHLAEWAGNSQAGTNLAHPMRSMTVPETTTALEGPLNQELAVGWLMGLEPTTTRITIWDSTN